MKTNPLDEFWAKRFLVTKDQDLISEQEEPGHKLNFNGLDDAYILFGDGISIGLEWHYAEQAMLFVTAFDIELYMIEGTEMKAKMSLI